MTVNDDINEWTEAELTAKAEACRVSAAKLHNSFSDQMDGEDINVATTTILMLVDSACKMILEHEDLERMALFTRSLDNVVRHNMKHAKAIKEETLQ